MASLKKEIKSLLENKDLSGVALLPHPPSRIVNQLISLSYDKKSSLSWRAIEAVGVVMKHAAQNDREAVRNTVGRLLWMIRDESGGIGWSVPEMLGEIVRNNPGLCADIAPVVASFHDEKMLTSGVLRAIGRIGKRNLEMTLYAAPFVMDYLESPEKIIRGYAAWALGEMHFREASGKLQKLVDDKAIVDIYEDGELIQKSVSELALSALEKLRADN